jgi:hypothetical protein
MAETARYGGATFRLDRRFDGVGVEAREFDRVFEGTIMHGHTLYVRTCAGMIAVSVGAADSWMVEFSMLTIDQQEDAS